MKKLIIVGIVAVAALTLAFTFPKNSTNKTSDSNSGTEGAFKHPASQF